MFKTILEMGKQFKAFRTKYASKIREYVNRTLTL